jgi:hypothetical protein
MSFLIATQSLIPDASRIMLTGAAELDMAIDAVNRGKIFRFLIKPCPSDMFINAVKAGIRQYQLLVSERELLSKTLNGSVKIMIDILGALNPELFSQATRTRDRARRLAMAIHLEQVWEVELAALLCQIGVVTLPQEVLLKAKSGQSLSEKENRMLAAVPKTGSQLVKNIPRLQNVAVAIENQNSPFGGRPGSLSGESIPAAARILKIVLDYERLSSKGEDPRQVFEEMAAETNQYDLFILEVFRQEVLQLDQLKIKKDPYTVPKNKKVVRIEDLQTGMVLVNDIVDCHGRLVIAKGTTITEVYKYKLIYFYWNESLYEPVLVESDENEMSETRESIRK